MDFPSTFRVAFVRLPENPNVLLLFPPQAVARIDMTAFKVKFNLPGGI